MILSSALEISTDLTTNICDGLFNRFFVGVFLLQTSFLTGFSLLYLKQVPQPEIKLVDIYKAVILFIILQLIELALTIIYPGLTTWLLSIAY